MAMEGLKFSEKELRLFGELFTICDAENTGMVFGPKASELFITSGLSTDVLHQVIDVCGAKRLGYFERNNFYIALKLIAVAQSGLSVTPESINSGIELPLPKFDIKKNVLTTNTTQHPNSQIPPPPKPVRGVHLVSAASNVNSHPQHQQDLSGSPTPQSPPLSPNSNHSNLTTHVATPTTKPHSQPVVTTTPSMNHQVGYNHYEGHKHHQTPQHQLQPHRLEKGWASFENDDDNQGLITEQRKEWAQFTDSSKADTSSVSSETDSMTDDVWHITEEQRDYYVNQFKTMQPDVTGVLSGAVAKDFFEKSRLPVSELSKIWQLSDVNKDGALNLEEFCTAMHLVVLRRNDIELPSHLPPPLLPYMQFANPDEPFASDLPKGSTIKKSSPNTAAPQQWISNNTYTIPESPASSSISSPGQKPTPLSFDFKPIEDSDIVHPKPMRVSPHAVEQQNTSTQQSNTDPGGYNSQDLSPNDQLSPATTQPPPPQLIDIGETQQQTTRTRPLAKKAQSVPGPTQQPLILPPSSSHDAAVELSTSAAQEVPVPPPRKSHSRSASLDTNQLLENTEKSKDTSVAPPMLPPRPKEGSNTESVSTVPNVASQKLTPDPGSSNEDTEAVKPKVLTNQVSQEKKELVALIKKQKEKNQTMCRLNGELNQELQEVMEQRIALEIQMEHLRPYGGSYL